MRINKAALYVVIFTLFFSFVIRTPLGRASAADPVDGAAVFIVRFADDPDAPSRQAFVVSPAAFYRVSKQLDVIYECPTAPVVAATGTREAADAVKELPGVDSVEPMPDLSGRYPLFDRDLIIETYLSADDDTIRFAVIFDGANDMTIDGVTWESPFPSAVRVGTASKKTFLDIGWPETVKSVELVPADNVDREAEAALCDVTPRLAEVLRNTDPASPVTALVVPIDGASIVADLRFYDMLRRVCLEGMLGDGAAVIVSGTPREILSIPDAGADIDYVDLYDPDDPIPDGNIERLPWQTLPDDAAEPTVGPVYDRPGDIDHDGYISARDARLALRNAVGLDELDEVQLELADLDSDGFVTVRDARMILRRSVGLT